METRAEDGSGLRVDLATGQVLQQIPFGKDGAGATRRALAASQPEPEAPLPDPVEQTGEAAPARREKSPALVLPGRLKSTPVDGRPDGHGKPTAWAHFLAHIDGQDGAVLLSATFHNHTRDAALGMSAGDTLTAQGYLHPSRDSERLSTFSIFRLIGQGNTPAVVEHAEGDHAEDESNLLDLHTFLARRRAAEGAHPPAPTRDT